MIKIKLHQSLFKKCLRVFGFDKCDPVEVENKHFKTVFGENVQPVVLYFYVLDHVLEHRFAVPRQVDGSYGRAVHVKY